MSNDDKRQIYKKRYQVNKKLGRGNSDGTYLVTDLEATNELKVLKVIRLNEMEHDQVPVSIREAERLSNLNNEHIVQFYESFLENDCLCLVTEYYEDGNLDQHLKKLKTQNSKLPEEQIVEWLTQILLAIQYLHKSRILHRDLKAKNIFLKSNQIKIGGFGLSRIPLTTFIGKPWFMSPEVLKNNGFESKSDIWSIGCLLYEMCTYQHAFKDRGLVNIVHNITEGESPYVPKMYSKELNDLFKRMLIKDPRKRPSASELLNSNIIQQYQRNKSTTSRNLRPNAINIDWQIRLSSSFKDQENTTQRDNVSQEVNPHGQLFSGTMKTRQKQQNKAEHAMNITASAKQLHPINNRTCNNRLITLKRGINRQIGGTLDSPQRSTVNDMNRAIAADDTDLLNVDPKYRAFGTIARGKRVDALRIKAIQLAGEDVYDQVYEYLMTQRTAQKSDPTIDEEKIKQGLAAFPGKPSDYFLIDQLVFLDMISI